MRNIASCPKDYIIRTYDLKGSTHDREVLKKKNNSMKDPSTMTLKDLDFVDLEKGKIHIPEDL